MIMRIARKLAQLQCDVGIMFGIFSKGQPVCTRENFKHCCLTRLNLGTDGLTERELDLLERLPTMVRPFSRSMLIITITII